MSPKKRPNPKTPRARVRPRALVVVAHPDDEALFFGGLIMSQKKYQWTIICVSDGNADGMGELRKKQFETSCKALGATGERWDFPDIFGQHFDIELLQERLQTLPPFNRVFTHGILGEYGHSHHQDVSYAVHKAFAKRCKVYSVAYNIFPEKTVALTHTLYSKKQKILWEIYASETRRLLHFLPATYYEGFTNVSMKEIEALYQWLQNKTHLNVSDLKFYKWLYEYLEEGGGRLSERPF